LQDQDQTEVNFYRLTLSRN